MFLIFCSLLVGVVTCNLFLQDSEPSWPNITLPQNFQTILNFVEVGPDQALIKKGDFYIASVNSDRNKMKLDHGYVRDGGIYFRNKQLFDFNSKIHQTYDIDSDICKDTPMH